MNLRSVVACTGIAVVALTSGCGQRTAPAAATGSAVTGSGPSVGATTTTALTASMTAATPISPAGNADGVFGDPGSVAKYWFAQTLEDNCGLVSVADVVGELTGQEPTEQQLIALALETPSVVNSGPIYAPLKDPSHNNGNGGISMGDLIVLLGHYGIKSAMVDSTEPERTGLDAIEHYLTANRKIIAFVNSAVVWDTSDQRTKPDHFLVVTGVDTNREIVHLNDPGADHADEQIPVAAFLKAWHTGDDSIVVTAAAT